MAVEVPNVPEPNVSAVTCVVEPPDVPPTVCVNPAQILADVLDNDTVGGLVQPHVLPTTIFMVSEHVPLNQTYLYVPAAENVVTVEVAELGVVITDVPGFVLSDVQVPEPVAAMVALPV